MRPKGATTTLGPTGPVKLQNPPAEGRSILRTFLHPLNPLNPLNLLNLHAQRACPMAIPQPSAPEGLSNFRTLRTFGAKGSVNPHAAGVYFDSIYCI